MKTTTLLAFLLLAAMAHGQTTTMDVPQGSWVFPTLGQVNCLEERGSGRLCAATYECADGESGELWGDMVNHDGRRVIDTDSPVAVKRSCSIEVSGKASVRWLSGYRPEGRTGEVIGLTSFSEAMRPVQVVRREGGFSGGTMLSYVLERAGVTLPEFIETNCGHIAKGHLDRQECDHRLLRQAVDMSERPNTPLVRCVIDAGYEVYGRLPHLGDFTERLFSYPYIVSLDHVLKTGHSRREYYEDSNFHKNCLDEANAEIEGLGLAYDPDHEYGHFYRLRE